MPRLLLTCAALAGLTLGACAAGQTDRQSLVDSGELTGETSDGDRVRCETVRQTGSRMTDRVCLTQREWDQMEENAQIMVEERANSQVVLPASGGGPN